MFDTVANKTLLGHKYICSPLKSKVSILGFVEFFLFGIESIVDED